MGTTDHYGLRRLTAGEGFPDGGYQFTDADRVLIDRLLYLGVEGHTHTGTTAPVPTLAAPTLTLSALSGSIPASTRAYYKYTLVDAEGFETAPSTEVFEDTASQLVEPAAPVLVVTSAGGTLLPGQYFYVLTAYKTTNTSETKALNPGYITVPVGTTTNVITITLPSLPAGATGFNVYRKGPGDSRYLHLESTVSTTTYEDDGSVEEDCNRTVPVSNTTNSTNSVSVDIGVVPVGYTWKLYRTYSAGYYQNTLVHHVVEETAEDSGIITGVYADMGLSALRGTPPVASQAVGGPSAIELTDMAAVSGTLPLAAVSAFPYVAEITVAGTLSAATGTFVWVCEFPQATIQGVRASLGRGYAPATQQVVVDVNIGDGATPTFSSIFASPSDQPRIHVGAQVGERVVPTARPGMSEGDVLTVDIDQAGGGATPTDRDLTVSLYMLVHGYSDTTSFVVPSALFTPAQIPDMLAWYKADAITGLADSAAVPSWIDSSGSGRTLLQATAGFRPVYKTGILNSKPVVRFDGSDDYLRATFATLPLGPRTIFCVAKTDLVSGNYYIYDGATGTDTMMLFSGGELYYQASGASGGASSNLAVPAVLPTTSWHIFATVYDSFLGNLRVGGNAGRAGTGMATEPEGITLGARGSLAVFLDGDFAEYILYDRVLTLAEINLVANHLATKYALTWATAV